MLISDIETNLHTYQTENKDDKSILVKFRAKYLPKSAAEGDLDLKFVFFTECIELIQLNSTDMEM